MQTVAPRLVMVPAMPPVAIPPLGMRTLAALRRPPLLPVAQVGLVAIASVAIPLVGLVLRVLLIRAPIPPTPPTPMETLAVPATVVLPVTAGLLGMGLLLLPLLPVLAGMRVTPRALAGTPASLVPRVALRTRRPRLAGMLVTAVTPAATAAPAAQAMVPLVPRMAEQVVPPPTADRAAPPVALLVAQGLVRQDPARPPTAEPRPTVGRVVQAPAGLRALAIAVRLVVVTAGRPRLVLARVVPVMLPAVLVTPRVTRAAVLAVPEAAVPVVMVLVRPERVAQVRPLRPVARTVALAGPVAPARAVPVVMLRVVPVRLVRPAPVVRVRAGRVVTPTLPAVPVRAGLVVTAPARVGTPLRVGSPRSVVRRRPARRLAPPVVTLRRTVEMPPERQGARPPRRVTVRSVGRAVTPGRVVLVPSAVRAALVALAVPAVPRPPAAVVRVLPTTPASTLVQRLRRRVALVVTTRRARRPGLRRITVTRPGPDRPTPAIRRPVLPRTGSAPMAVSTSAARISVWRTSGITTRAWSTTVTFSAC